MPSSYILMLILAVVGIILGLIWTRSANRNEKIYRDYEESTEWARKWNDKWGCCNKCKECEENDNCFFSEVKL